MDVTTNSGRQLEIGKRSPRVAILSLREIYQHVSAANGYDFEDAIAADLDEAQILSPLLGSKRSQFALNVINWAERRNLPTINLGLGSLATRMVQDADLFFFFVPQLRDLQYLAALPQWRDRSRFAVCWLQEAWLTQIVNSKRALNVLNRFDHVISPFHFSTSALASQLEVPVSYLPWGVDTTLFCPFPHPPRRAVDLLAVGKNDPATHADLIAYADALGKFYHYETVKGRAETTSHAAHRRNYAGILKRSKYFLTYMAKVSTTDHRGTQEEFGLRYVEGVASGAVLLGDRVSNPTFVEWFGWPDSVISSPYGSRNLPALIDDLEANPSRVAMIRRRNIVEALRRHDHLHRWENVLKIAGMPTLPKLESRRKRLADLTARTASAEETFFSS